jgi:hypothetical protein
MYPRHATATERPKPRLVARNGQLVGPVGPTMQPEATLYVSFHGLTEAEQRLALSTFPGGRRFRLVGTTG